GTGALLGGLVFSRVFAADRLRRISPTAMAITTAMTVGLVVTTWWVIAVAVLVVFQWSNSITTTTGITYRQLAAPDDLRSSVNVFGRMISWGGQPFGAVTGALISASLDVRAAYVFAAIVLAIGAAGARAFIPKHTAI